MEALTTAMGLLVDGFFILGLYSFYLYSKPLPSVEAKDNFFP